MSKQRQIGFQIIAILLFSFAAATALILSATATKDEGVQKVAPASLDEVHIKVNQDGYFLEDGSRVTEALRLPRGHHVKIVFHYAYLATITNATQPDESPIHQFTIRAADSAGKDTFRLQSKPLSPENTEVEMELDVGRDGIQKYMMYCDINCNAMGQLFKEIEVLG